MNENRHNERARAAAGGDLLSKLTPREREVLSLYLELLNDKKVARRLGTKLQTVRNQLASIEHKLRARSREELIVLCVRDRGFSDKPGSTG